MVQQNTYKSMMAGINLILDFILIKHFKGGHEEQFHMIALGRDNINNNLKIFNFYKEILRDSSDKMQIKH